MPYGNIAHRFGASETVAFLMVVPTLPGRGTRDGEPRELNEHPAADIAATGRCSGDRGLGTSLASLPGVFPASLTFSSSDGCVR